MVSGDIKFVKSSVKIDQRMQTEHVTWYRAWWQHFIYI